MEERSFFSNGIRFCFSSRARSSSSWRWARSLIRQTAIAEATRIKTATTIRAVRLKRKSNGDCWISLRLARNATATIRNRERTRVPKRAARLRWSMRPDPSLNDLCVFIKTKPVPGERFQFELLSDYRFPADEYQRRRANKRRDESQ